MQIEIHQPVNQEARACDQSSDLQCLDKRVIARVKVFDSASYENSDKRQPAKSADDSGFRQKFEVIVVNVVNGILGVERFELWINGNCCAETGANPGACSKHMQGAAHHGNAAGLRNFRVLNLLKPPDDLIRAHPGDKSSREQEDHQETEQVALLSASQQKQQYENDE